MSRFQRVRVMTARAAAAFFYAQLFLMNIRDRMINLLILLPMMLLPRAVLAEGDLADMLRSAGDGAKSAQTSSLSIAQFIGVIMFIGGLVGFKKVGKQGGIGLGACIASVIIGAVLTVVPEVMNREQRQLGTSATTIN
ncbi:conjugal transfer protein TraR [Salmonella enterica subsp. enterica serovar Urbana]|nr:conjugal transfer protein TraR [Salmonella enterica subsp. enterica serovar Urbana]ECZ5203277.1 conjugal transfer protein TraR [Salmonella enterica subsp. enterica serovar Kentucky]EDA9520891.1 conjugal transfer protein TraR [Salmonella enterica subsp. enterica serovar Kentucky]HAF2120076.1 conjugal transfer protein TraR [Salmonella enterica]